MDDHYATLQVSPDAPVEVVEAAYRALTKVHGPTGTHPDRRRMRTIDEAWRVLGDLERRIVYDAERALEGAARDPDAVDLQTERPSPPAEAETEAEAERTDDLGAEYVEDEPADQRAPPSEPSPTSSQPAGSPRWGQPPPLDDPTAVVGLRMGAFFLDALTVAALMVALWVLAVGALARTPWEHPSFVWWLPVVLLATHVLLQGRTGSTPGKRALDLRTVRNDGRPPGMLRALVRTILLLLLLGAQWPGVGVAIVLVLATTGHRHVGDLLARTYVVRSDYAGAAVTPPEPAWITWVRQRLGNASWARAALVWTTRSKTTSVLTAGVSLVVVTVVGLGVVNVAAAAWSTVSRDSTENEPELLPPAHRAVWRGHTDVVTAVALSPDADLLATASDDETVRLWSTKTYERITTLEHRDKVGSVAFSPDGTLLASTDDEAVRLWDVGAFEEVATLEHDPSVSSGLTGVTFSPDGSRVAVANGSVQMWDVESQEEIVPPTESAAAGSVAFSPDGTLLATAGVARLWDVESQEAVLIDDRAITSVAFSPDGNLLAASDTSGDVRLWDVETHEATATLRPGGDEEPQVLVVAFAPDGALLTNDGDQLQLWDLATAEEHNRLFGHRATVTSAEFSSDGGLLATADVSGDVHLWDARPEA